MAAEDRAAGLAKVEMDKDADMKSVVNEGADNKSKTDGKSEVIVESEIVEKTEKSCLFKRWIRFIKRVFLKQ